MLAVLCPGQGGQHERMLDLLQEDAVAACVLAESEDVLGVHPRSWMGDASRMFENAIAQPLVCVAQVAAWSALRGAVPRPLAFAGYSVGELGAYGCAEAMECRDLVRLALRRAELMETAAATVPSGMLALRGLDRRHVDELCAGRQAWVAIVIDATGYVLGGTLAALAIIQEDLRGTDAKVTCLKVGIASHTPLLSGAVEPFRHALDASPLRPPAVAVVSGIDGAVRMHRTAIIDALARQLAETIEWAQCLQSLYERGSRVFLELGPGRALTQMVRERFPDAQARALDDFRSLSGVAAWVSREMA